MGNPGTNLEFLVKQIEQSLAPEGFAVEANQRSVEDGVVVGEFDIVITGRVGSMPIKYLIECRDRPSKGPQGREWIQQLIGRRIDFKFNGVAAVSTTGFTDAAKALAKKEKISLRTVKEAAEIAEGIKLVSFTLGNPEIRPLGPLHISPIEDKEGSIDRNFRNEELRFRQLTEIEGKDFYNFVLSNLPEKFSKEDGNHFLQFRVAKVIEVVAADRRIMANEITVPLLIRSGHITGKAIAMRDYDSETGLVAQEVSVLFDAPIGSVKTEWAFAFAENTFSINLLKVDWPGNHPAGASSITCKVSEEPIPPPG